MKSYHEKTSAAWDAMAEKGWGENRRPSPFFKKFYEQHRAELGKDVLDVGCGNGAYIVPLAQDGYNVVGLDLSEGMFDGARARIEAENVQTSLVRGKSSELPFPDNNFDFVLSIGAMHHNTWEDVEKSFAEVKRVLRPGKLFLFQSRSVSDTSPTREQIVDTGLTSIDTTGMKKDVVHHYFTREELLTLASQNDFEIVEGPEEKISTKETESDNQHARWWVVFKKREAKVISDPEKHKPILETERGGFVEQTALDSEKKSELPPVLVTVEQLIPDIKPKEITKSSHLSSGKNWDDVYADRVLKYLNVIFGDYGLEEKRLLKDGLKDQIVVDLGAGNRFGYAAALGGGARGYIAVDKFYDLANAYSNPEMVRSFVDKAWPLFCQDKELIPAAAEQDDMLSFLKRLPDNSVSIISSGHVSLFDGAGGYIMEVKKEMLRVLSPSGLLIVNEGISPNDENLVSEVWEYGTCRVLVKKGETRSKRVEKADEAFRIEIVNETDIERLRTIENQLSDDFRTTDYYRISIVTDRIKQLQKD